MYVYINTISQFIILIKYKKNYYNTLISSILSIILHILLVEFQNSIFSLFFKINSFLILTYECKY